MKSSSWMPSAIRKTLMNAASDAVLEIEADFIKRTSALPPEKVHLIERLDASDTNIADASRFFDVTLVEFRK